MIGVELEDTAAGERSRIEYVDQSGNKNEERGQSTEKYYEDRNG